MLCRSSGDLEEVAFSIDGAVADPYLYAENTHLRERLGEAVVHVCAERVQRNTALLDGFAAGHFGAADTSGYLNLDSFRTHAHGRCDGRFDGAAERYTAFKLPGDVLTYDDGIHLGAFYLEDVDLNLLAGKFLQLFLEFVNLLTALADDDTRTGRRDGYRNQFERTLDDNLGNACLSQTDIQILADFGIFDEFVGEVLAAVPVGIPTANDTKTICYRIYLLSHCATCFLRLPFCPLRSSRDSNVCEYGVRDPEAQPEYVSACGRHRQKSP